MISSFLLVSALVPGLVSLLVSSFFAKKGVCSIMISSFLLVPALVPGLVSLLVSLLVFFLLCSKNEAVPS